MAIVLDAYLADRKGEVNDYSRLTEAATALKATLGHKIPQDLDKRDYQRHSRRKSALSDKRITSDTARRELSMLNTALRAAGIQPPAVKLPKRGPGRDRFLSKAEAARLMEQAASYHLRIFLMIALATGARKSAILDLTWARVDLDRKRIDFRPPGRAETNKKRGVCPIGARLTAALRDAKQITQSNFVIEWNAKPLASIKRSFKMAAERAGVVWCTPHYLKHTAISWFAEEGFSIDEISDMTDTDSETVKRIYRKFNPDYLKPMAERMDEILFVPTPLAQTPAKGRTF